MDYRTDLWHDNHVELHQATVLDPNHKPVAFLYQMRYDVAWRPFVQMGRGKGTYPKPPFHVFRDYRQASPSLGPNHIRIYATRPTNSCEICGHTAAGFRDTKLDYFAFYKTGEIFTWADPAWLNGHIQFDPRQHIQPEGSPFAIKWICETCYNLRLEDALTRIREYEIRWDRYKFAFHYSPPQRYLIDRRVLDAPWYDTFTKNPPPDRRVLRRRHTDVGPTFAEQLDARVAKVVST